jgi:predicted MFS family arabinose efflux permease
MEEFRMNKKLLYFLIVYFISIALTLNMQVIPPLLPHIIRDWNIQRSQAGLLMGITSLPPLFFGILGGYILDTFGVKIPTIISLILYLIGQILFILSKNFSMILLSRVILGFGAIILGVVGLKILAEKFQGREFGKYMGINSTAMPLSTLFSFNILGFIANKYSWKIPMFILAIYTLFLIIFILSFYKDEKKIQNSENIFLSIRTLSKKVWILGILWLLFNAGSLSFITFAPDYFIYKGFSFTTASSISSLYIIGALFSPIIGYFLDKTSKPYIFIFIGSILLSINLLLIYFSKKVIILIITAGIFSALIPPTVFYLLPRFTDKFGLGYSVLSSLINLGILFAPSFIGYIKDISGNYFLSFLFISLFILVSGVVSFYFK